MTEPKQTQADFKAQFLSEWQAKRDELIALGFDVDNPDIGIPLTQLQEWAGDHPTDESIIPWLRKNAHLIGDAYWASPYVKDLNPMTIAFIYKGKTISTGAFGPSVYQDVYGHMWSAIKRMADNFLVSAKCANDYLDGNQEARTALLQELDFQTHRNWTIIWAKTDWLRKCFPRAYERMLGDEFLSVEDLEAKMKEGG